jgi:hypothetical protein
MHQAPYGKVVDRQHLDVASSSCNSGCSRTQLRTVHSAAVLKAQLQIDCRPALRPCMQLILCILCCYSCQERSWAESLLAADAP